MAGRRVHGSVWDQGRLCAHRGFGSFLPCRWIAWLGLVSQSDAFLFSTLVCNRFDSTSLYSVSSYCSSLSLSIGVTCFLDIMRLGHFYSIPFYS